MNRLYKLIVVALGLSMAGLAQAEFRFARIFSDHQILQREMNVPVWGFDATPAATVSVTFDGQLKTTTAESDGTWSVELDPMAANTNSQNLVVNSDGATVTLTDVLVGEVWLAGGQSNMDRGFTLDINKGYTQREADRLLADYPLVRFKKLEQDVKDAPLDDLRRGPYLTWSSDIEFWQAYTPETARDSSSLPYYFVKKLYEELNVPIGIIQHCVSGTRALPWVREEVVTQLIADGKLAASELQLAFNYRDEQLVKLGHSVWQDLEDEIDAWDLAPSGGRPGKGQIHNTPYVLFNAMVNPIAGYAVRGLIWHRGENGETNDEHANVYKAMVEDYRSLWGQDFHVIAGCLSNIGDTPDETPVIGGMNGDVLINQQYMSNKRDYDGQGREITDFDLVSFQDLGNHWRDDISQSVKDANGVHFEAKDEAGRRMALTALSSVYGDTNKSYKTPIFNRAFLDDQNRVRIKLDHAEGGLVINTNNFIGDNKGFVIDDGAGNLYYADVALDGDHLLVWHASAPNPASVHYAWLENPKLTLYNSADLPVLYFRATDIDPLLDGDANLDAVVDGNDLNLLAAHWGQASGATLQDGDFNGDGAVNQADLDTYQANAADPQADTDGDGMPDWWEGIHFGDITNTAPTALCSNGVNVARDAYIAGLDPNDPAALFTLDAFEPLTWNAVSGRIYNVYWTSNLLSGFQTLETNISGGAFTDLTYGATSAGFYKIEVQLDN